MQKVYLDYAAATPLSQDVVEQMLPFFTESFGNPQSRHPFGTPPKKAVEHARSQIAALIGANPNEIYFTSSASEANNMILNGLLFADTGKQSVKKHIITSVVEHHSILHCCKRLTKLGYEVTYLPVDKNGFVSASDLKTAIREDTALISIMHANNEIGTIEPIEELVKIAAEHNIPFHSDGAGSVGMIPVDVKNLGVHFLSFSAQQFGGPKGVGALYARKGSRVTPMLLGGIQENGRRAGTENVPGIVGMGAAAQISKDSLTQNSTKMTILRDKLISGIQKINYTYITGSTEKRLPNIISCCIQYIEGEAMTLLLQAKGIMVSSGSTCSSHALKASSVILSIGIPQDIAQGSLVFSLGTNTTEQDIDFVLEHLPPVVARLRDMSPLYEDLMNQKNKGE